MDLLPGEILLKIYEYGCYSLPVLSKKYTWMIKYTAERKVKNRMGDSHIYLLDEYPNGYKKWAKILSKDHTYSNDYLIKDTSDVFKIKWNSGRKWTYHTINKYANETGVMAFSKYNDHKGGESLTVYYKDGFAVEFHNGMLLYFSDEENIDDEMPGVPEINKQTTVPFIGNLITKGILYRECKDYF